MRLWVLLLLLAMGAGCGGPEPRKPVKATSANFMKASAERNRELLEAEEK